MSGGIPIVFVDIHDRVIGHGQWPAIPRMGDHVMRYNSDDSSERSRWEVELVEWHEDRALKGAIVKVRLRFMKP